MVSAFFSAYNARLQQENADPSRAVAQAVADVSFAKVASRAIGSLLAGSAYDGVEDTGGPGGLDGKGGSLWMLHPNERVVPKSINDQLKGISNEDLPMLASMYKSPQAIVPLMGISSDYKDIEMMKTMNYGNEKVINQLRSLEKTIKNKPETKLHANSTVSYTHLTLPTNREV